MVRNSILNVFFLAGLFFLNDSLFSQEWFQWLGPYRNGISPDEGLIKSWSGNGPEIVWKDSIGDGFSSVTVTDGKAFCGWSEGEDEYLYCLDALTGKVVWNYRIGPLYRDDWGDGPRSSPVVDNEMVYIAGSYGNLHAVNRLTGEGIWNHDLVKEYGSLIPQWGYSCSPLIEQNMLLVDVGGTKNHAFMAFDKYSGKVIWNTYTDTLAWASPIIADIQGQRQILFYNLNGLHSLSSENGELLWQYRQRASNIPTPMFIPPDKVFISCSYNVGSTLLQIEKSDSSFKVNTIWKNKIMQNHFNSSVLVGDYLYGFDNAFLKCIDFKTGAQKWQKVGLGKGSLIYADSMLIVLSERGKLLLVKADPEKYIEMADFQALHGRCWTSPSLTNGHLFLRSREEIVCINLNKSVN